MSISMKKIRFWADNNYNVIFCGRHGVGKTSIVESVFNERYGKQGQDWLYFSAATMDPWVDFIGVPKEKEDGDVSYLELIRPKVFALDQVQAIFFDEYNRSPKKVRNAVMELMQFHSINGHKFHNLKVIWGAINPPESDEDDMVYDVETIDPAQLDRFHVYVDIPYTVSKSFFKEKYGEVEGIAACDWWQSLSTKQRDAVSPRRLDYAIGCWAAGGDIRDILPAGMNTTELQRQLRSGSYKLRLNKLMADGVTEDEVAEAFKDEQLFQAVKHDIAKDDRMFAKIVPLLEDEKMMTFFAELTPKKIKNRLESIGDDENVLRVMKELATSSTKFLTAPKRREIQAWVNLKNRKNLKDELAEDDFNDLEKDMLDLLRPNACNDPEFREIETENTYYRKKRFKQIISFLVKHKNEIQRFQISLPVQASVYDGIVTMCERSQTPTLNDFSYRLRGQFSTVFKRFIKDVEANTDRVRTPSLDRVL